VLLPPWWVVVILSGIAPAVLGAMVHLAVLVGRPHERVPLPAADEPRQPERSEPTAAPHPPGPPSTWNTPPPAAPGPPDEWAATDEPADTEHDPAVNETGRAAALIAAGVGRRRLSRELGVTEYEARRLLERSRPTATPTDGDTPAVALDTPIDPTLAGARS
jgi:hypothetical protein